MRLFSLAAAIFAIPALSLAQSAENPEAPAGQLPEGVAPTHYDLDFKVDPDQERFSGETDIDITLAQPTDLIWMHGRDLNVTNVTFTTADGEQIGASYEQVLPSGVSKLTLTEAAPAGDAVLHFEYDAPFGNLAGIYRVEEEGRWYVTTQMEAIDARRAFPGFDEPRFKVPFDVTITAPEDAVAIFNTPETGAESEGEGWTRHAYETTRPLPTYLIAMAVGPWEINKWRDIPPNDVRDVAVPLRGLAAQGKAGKMDYALENTSGLLTALEEYFGSPYPYYGKLDLIASPEFAFGAMENPGAIVYVEPLLVIDQETASVQQLRSYAGTHAHEMAHQWVGDLVTPKWWTDIWLNESFATWMAGKATAAWAPDADFGRGVLRSAAYAMSTDALDSTRRIREPVTRNDAIMDSFDGITYSKGAAVLAMMEQYLGEETFQAGVRHHLTRFADSTATAEDFYQSIADKTDKSGVVEAFKSFIEQPGVPLVMVDMSCDENSGDGPSVTLTQSRYAPLGSPIQQNISWDIPVCMDTDDGRQCAMLAEKSAQAVLPQESCPAYVMPNAGGAGYYRFDYSGEGWESLLAHFGDLDAGEQFSAYNNLYASLQAGRADAETWVEGARKTAGAETWDVAGQATGNIAFLYQKVLDAGGRAAVAPFVRDLYVARLESIKDDNGLNATLLRSDLTGFVAKYGDYAALNEDLTAKGRAWLGMDGEADASAVQPELAEAAATAALRDGGQPVYDAMIARLDSEPDYSARRNMVSALGQMNDADRAADLRARILQKPFTAREMGTVIYSQLSNPETRETAWTWLQANFDAVLARLPGVQRAGTARVAGAFCSTDRLDQAEAFFESKADLMPGYERSLAQGLERARLCAAFKESQGAALSQALQTAVASDGAQ